MLQGGLCTVIWGKVEFYRFGFNGKEMDNETSGTGNMYDYGFRIYNPRLGKFLSIDPLTQSYPSLTPYQFASNRPIDGIDLDGLEYITYHVFIKNGETSVVIQDHRNLSETLAAYNYEQATGKRIDSDEFYNKFSQSFGEMGRGALYIEHNEDNGKSTWRFKSFYAPQDQGISGQSGVEDLKWHGLYYGAGCITKYGGEYSSDNPYDFDQSPIDEVDAIAYIHDLHYSFPGYKEGSFMNDPKTAVFDAIMVNQLKQYLERAQQEGYIDKFTNRPPSEEALDAAKKAIKFIGALKYKKVITISKMSEVERKGYLNEMERIKEYHKGSERLNNMHKKLDIKRSF